MDDIGIYNTKIAVYEESANEFKTKFGTDVNEIITQLMKKQRISTIFEVRTDEMKGEHSLQEIKFVDLNGNKGTQLFLRPDLVILESSKVINQVDYRDLLHLDNPANHPRLDKNLSMIVDGSFAIHYGRHNPEIFAVGQCAATKSFITKGFYRTNDVKYNIENGFYAAMSMLSKSIIFN